MDGELDLPGGIVEWRWRFPVAGIAIIVAIVILARWPVPGTGAAARALDGLAALALAFERWVIDAVAGALATLVVAAAWTADVLDRDVLAAPGDALAGRVVRVAGAVRPVVGGSIARVAWTLLALLATAGVAHAAWPGR